VVQAGPREQPTQAPSELATQAEIVPRRTDAESSSASPGHKLDWFSMKELVRPFALGRAALPLLAAIFVGCAAAKPIQSSPLRLAALPSTAAAAAPAAPLDAQVFAAVDPGYAFLGADRKRKLASAFVEVDAIVREEMTARKLPGVAVGIVIDGELAYAEGFGFADLEKKTRPDADTVFRIGSITKSVTALALLSLRDEGALRLDDPLTRFVPEAAGLVYPARDAPPITLRQLLTHTSGLPGRGSFAGAQAPSESDVLRSLGGFALEDAPGSTFRYSNLGFSLLGIASGRAGRAPFREVVGTRVLAPWGMTSTVWDVEGIPANRVATGYVVNEHADPHPAERVVFGAAEGAGGLYSSVRDMARYVAHQLDAYPARNAPETGTIRRSTLREAHSTGFQSDLHVGVAEGPKKGESLVRISAEAYGFGWVAAKTCDFDDLVAHNGLVPGYMADIEFLRERGVGVVSLANATPGDPSSISIRIIEALKRTGGLSKRSKALSPAFDPAMKKLLSVYNAWDEATYLAMQRPGRSGIHGSSHDLMVLEREELDGYKNLHGACRAFWPIEIKTPREARFKMDCERGPFEMLVTLSREGTFIDGFVGISRDAPMSKELRAVADPITGLIRRWDDAVYKRYLSKTTKTRNEAFNMFEGLRASHGACVVKSSTVVAFDRNIVLECERGGDLALFIDLDKKDPSTVSMYRFGGASESICPAR
jgi:CubicO group peptidase (beta-lactamase class C family)